MYVEIAAPDQQFGSTAELLEAVWNHDVVSAPDADDRAAILHDIAAAMTADEQLSVPASFGDDRPAAVTGLLALDLRRSVSDDVVANAAADDPTAAGLILKALKADTRHELLEELATKRPALFIEQVWSCTVHRSLQQSPQGS